jgi:SsrA-binding protein
MARAKQIQEKRAQKRVDANAGDRVVATNRRARYDYEIIETLECGIMLSGSEVKSLREGKAQIAESYARFDDTELWLYQMHVPPWVYATGFGSHDPDRRRKLLAHRHELDQWQHETRTEPLTMVPLKLYFKDGKAKVELALAKGKKSQDRRQAIAKRDSDRDIARAIRHTEKYS